MDELLRTLVTFPTMPLTVAMGVVLLYWLLVMVGAIGLDGMGEGAAAGAKAAGDAVTGALKGIDAKGGLVEGLGLGQVPITIPVSIFTFIGWAGTFIGSAFLTPETLLAQSGVLVGSLMASAVVTRLTLRPLNRVFSEAPGRRRADVVGRLCVITSQRVDASFGTAEVLDGGHAALVHVVCSRPNSLKKGDKALLVAAVEGRENFEVTPLDFLEPDELRALDDPERRQQVLASRLKL